MALEFALAGEREELAELLLAVAIATASDVRPVDDDEHDVVAARMLVPLAVMLVGDLLTSEQTVKLIGQAAGHRRLTDADPTVKKEALEGAAGDLVAPLMGHDRGGLRQHVPISLADDIVGRRGGAIRAGHTHEWTELLLEPIPAVEVDVTIAQ